VLRGIVYKDEELPLRTLQVVHERLGVRQNECIRRIEKDTFEMNAINEQVAILQQQLQEKNQQWQSRKDSVFSPVGHQNQAQAALARLDRLSPVDREKHASLSVIPGVTTPKGIADYWQAKINGNLFAEEDEFSRMKCASLDELAKNISLTQSLFQNQVNLRDVKALQINNFKYYANQYIALFPIATDLLERKQAAEELALQKLQQQELEAKKVQDHIAKNKLAAQLLANLKIEEARKLLEKNAQENIFEQLRLQVIKFDAQKQHLERSGMEVEESRTKCLFNKSKTELQE